jgi:hypothetical protein
MMKRVGQLRVESMKNLACCLIALSFCSVSYSQQKTAYGLSDINTQIAVGVVGQPMPSQMVVRAPGGNNGKFVFSGESRPIKVNKGQRYKLTVLEIDEKGQKSEITQSEHLKFNALWKGVFHVAGGYLIVQPEPGWSDSSATKTGTGHLAVEYLTPKGNIGFTSIAVEVAEDK